MPSRARCGITAPRYSDLQARLPVTACCVGPGLLNAGDFRGPARGGAGGDRRPCAFSFPMPVSEACTGKHTRHQPGA